MKDNLYRFSLKIIKVRIVKKNTKNKTKNNTKNNTNNNTKQN